MKKITFHVSFLGISLFSTVAFCANILVLYPGSGRSHKIAVMPIVEELAKRGHEITIISAYPTSVLSDNIHDIVLPESDNFFNNMPFSRFDSQKAGFMEQIELFIQEFLAQIRVGYESMMKHPEFRQILKDRKVDLIIHDGLFSEYCRVISHHLRVPSIAHYSTASTTPINLSPMGATADFASVPTILSSFDGQMNFFERMANMLQSEISEMFYKYSVLSFIDEMIKKDFPDSPSVEELAKETSLAIINSHPVTSWPRSLPPTVISIGALHTKPAEPLPKDLESFVDDANGFIVFTLGSHIPGSSIPKEALQIFMNVFAKLPQKVIWKWEGELPEQLPKNIMMAKWLPQQDLLGHPKVKLFITHGGLQGTYEAIYHAVPLLCLPLGADQIYNCVKAKKEGYALSLNWDNITDEILERAVMQILNDSAFKMSATRVSSLIKDELVPGKEVGAYWVEHVLRHGGTKHLQSPGKNMPFYQYYLLDVFSFLILLSSILLLVFYRFIRWTARKCCRNLVETKIKDN